MTDLASEPASTGERKPPARARVPLLLMLLSGLLALVPLGLLVVALARFALDVPLWDEWELTPLVVRSLDGTLGWGELWAQHNEHRIFFPKLWMLAIVRATNGSIGVELAGNVLVATLLLVCLAYRAKKLLENEGSRAFWVLLPILSWLVFSQVQWENWITGWQVQIWLAVLSFVLAAFALLRAERRPPDLIFALVCALVGTFSFADGVLIWPVLFGAFFLGVRGVDWRRAGATWLGVGAVAAVLYLLGYHSPPDHPSPLATLGYPLRFADYVLRFLGVPLVARDGGIQRVLGAVGLFVAVFGGRALVRRGVARERLTPWLALAAWAFACALLAGLGRAGMGEGYGPAQAKAPRYVTLATPLWVADAVILLLLARRETGGKLERFAPRIALAGLATLLVVNSIRQGGEMTARLRELRPARDLIVEGDIATVSTDAIAKLLPDDRRDVALLRKRVAALRERKLGAFGGH